MKNFTTDAINIKTYPLSEYDNIVVMFSRQKGVIKGVAKGVKRPKSKLGARMQTLIANRLMLYEGKNLDTICQAQALNTFAKLRKDLDKLSYSLYLAEIISVFCQEND
jgi:DNA repair protein RecO (recombination protein O)